MFQKCFRCSGPTSHLGTLWARGPVLMVSTPTFCWWMMERWENMAASKVSGGSWRNTFNYKRYTPVSNCVCVFVHNIQEVRKAEGLGVTNVIIPLCSPQDWTKECRWCVWWWREALLWCPRCWTMWAVCPLCQCLCLKGQAGLPTFLPSYTSRLPMTGIHAYVRVVNLKQWFLTALSDKLKYPFINIRSNCLHLNWL